MGLDGIVQTFLKICQSTPSVRLLNTAKVGNFLCREKYSELWTDAQAAYVTLRNVLA
jgi:hypothetical protein